MAAVLLELIPELIELAEGAEAAEGILSAEAGFDAVLGGEVAGLDAVGGDFIAANEAGDIGVGAAADDATADVILENVAEDAIADTLPTSRMKWLISNTKRFGKWAAIEAGKAAIIQVGFEALLAVIKHLAERPDSPTIAQEAKASAEGFMGVLKRVFAIVNEWHAFGQKHLAKGRMYDVLIVNHVVLLRFELYVRQLAVLDGERGKVLTAVADAKKKGTPEAVLALRPVLKAYVDQVADLGKWIEEQEPLMKHDGLAGRVEELQEAQHTVNVA